MKYIGLVALLVLSLGVASPSPDCRGEQIGDVGPHPVMGSLPVLANSSWTLTAMGNAESLRMVSDTPPVTLEFLEAGAGLKGDTGCNTYSGLHLATYENGYGGISLQMVDFEITERGCPTQDLFDREVEYRDTLVNAQSATVIATLVNAPNATEFATRLTIESATGGILILDRNYSQ